MTGSGRGGDGVSPAGSKNGRKYWELRIVYKCPNTGIKKDTIRKIQADSRTLAVLERAKLADQLSRSPKSHLIAASRTFAEVGDEWFSTIKVHATRVSWGSHLRYLRETFGEYLLDRFTTLEIQAYLGRQNHLGLGTLRQRKQVLRRIFGFALDKGYLAVDPTAGLRPLPRPNPRANDDLDDPPKRALVLEEVQTFFADLALHAPDILPLTRTQLVCGLRFSEVTALRPTDVDWDTGIVKIRRGQTFGHVGKTKGKYARTVALDPETLALVRVHREHVLAMGWPGATEWLFPRPPSGRQRHSDHWAITTASQIYKRSWERIGVSLDGATHVLRRSAVDLIREHISQPLLQLIFGHRDSELSRTYSSAQPIEAISTGAKIGSLLTSGT